MIELVILCSPHLVLSNIRSNNSLTFGGVIDHLNYPLRFELSLGIVVAKRVIQLPLGNLCSPGIGTRCTGHFRNQQLQHCLNISDNRNVRRHVFADFRRIDVDMNDFRFWREAIQLAGHTVIKPGTDVDQQIALLNSIIRCISSVHTGHSHPQLIRTRITAESQQSGCNRDFCPLHEFIHCFMSSGVDYPAACNNDRTFRGRNGPNQLIQLELVRNRTRVIAAEVNALLLHWTIQCLGSRYILRNVDQYRTFAAGVRDMESFMNDARKFFNITNQVAVLRNRHRNACNIRFLESISSNQAGEDISGDYYEWY
ncbi:hypothetical protein D3C75_644670 [compost metagenome]